MTRRLSHGKEACVVNGWVFAAFGWVLLSIPAALIVGRILRDRQPPRHPTGGGS